MARAKGSARGKDLGWEVGFGLGGPGHPRETVGLAGWCSVGVSAWSWRARQAVVRGRMQAVGQGSWNEVPVRAGFCGIQGI